TVLFDAPLRFDLADAQAAPPPGVAGIAARPGEGKTAVEFDFTNGPDVRTFREDSNFIVDVLGGETKDVPAELVTLANAGPPSAPPRSPAIVPPQVTAERAPVPNAAPAPKAAERPAAAPPAGAVASKGPDAPTLADVPPPTMPQTNTQAP